MEGRDAVGSHDAVEGRDAVEGARSSAADGARSTTIAGEVIPDSRVIDADGGRAGEKPGPYGKGADFGASGDFGCAGSDRSAI